MIKLLFFFILSITTCFVQAQECSDLFAFDVSKLFNHKEKEFDKKVHNTLKEHTVNIKDIEIIFIPEMFVTQKGEKLYRDKKADKEDLICHLNKKKLRFDDSFIFSDVAIIGVVSRFNTNDLKFYDATSTYANHLRSLMLEVRRITPDFIFRIYNLPQCYWYVKNDRLYVLTYEHTDDGLSNFVTVSADEYLKHYINGTDLEFLSHKPVEIISNTPVW